MFLITIYTLNKKTNGFIFLRRITTTPLRMTCKIADSSMTCDVETGDEDNFSIIGCRTSFPKSREENETAHDSLDYVPLCSDDNMATDDDKDMTSMMNLFTSEVIPVIPNKTIHPLGSISNCLYQPKKVDDATKFMVTLNTIATAVVAILQLASIFLIATSNNKTYDDYLIIILTTALGICALIMLPLNLAM